MSKVIELRDMIKDYIKTVHPRVYFQAAPKNAIFPYIVFDLPNSIDDGSMENFVLDIDGWDNEIDTTALETLMAAIDGDGVKLNPSGLHRKTVILPDDTSATFYRENRLSIIDEDKKEIRRRKIIYQVRTHKGG